MLAVSMIGIAVGVVVGTTLGLVAGYLRGWFDGLVMRLVDISLALTAMLLGDWLRDKLDPRQRQI